MRIEHERQGEEDWFPAALTAPALAQYSGRCPLCDKYISKGRSWIVGIPPARPREGVFYDDERSIWRDQYTGDEVGMQRRSWAHAKCQEREERHHRRRQAEEAQQHEHTSTPHEQEEAPMPVHTIQSEEAA